MVKIYHHPDTFNKLYFAANGSYESTLRTGGILSIFHIMGHHDVKDTENYFSSMFKKISNDDEGETRQDTPVQQCP